MRLKRLFHASDSATLFFINLCARFCFESSPSFCILFFSFHVCVFFVFLIFVLHHPFGILIFSSFLSLCFYFLFVHSFSFLTHLLAYSLTCLLAYSYLITTIIIIYNILISFVCVRICARTCARTRQGLAKIRHKKRAAKKPPFACYPKIHLNVKTY